MECKETMFFKIVSHADVYPMGILLQPDGNPMDMRGGRPALYRLDEARMIARQMGYDIEVGR